MTIREPGIGTRPEQARKRSSADEARRKREKNIEKRKAAANAERAKVAGSNDAEDNLTTSGLDETEEEEEEEDSSDDADEDAPDFIDVPDVRLTIPSTVEETIAIRDALVGTIDQAKSMLEEFTPIIHEPHSYAWQAENVQQQFDTKYKARNPDLGKAPTLMHLTFWSGGLQDWRSAKYWDGSCEYLIEEDGTIGSRYSQTQYQAMLRTRTQRGSSLCIREVIALRRRQALMAIQRTQLRRQTSRIEITVNWCICKMRLR